MDVSRKIMEILDDNAQQVPEGFYLEVCNQLKKLHLALPTSDDLERRELAVRRARIRLNRQAGELNDLKANLTKVRSRLQQMCGEFKEDKERWNSFVEIQEDKRKLEQQVVSKWRIA
jgi:hypothetical protein